MNNWVRFLLGLGSLFFLIVIGLIVFVVLSPALLVGGLLIAVIVGIIVSLIAALSFFSFVFYAVRKDPRRPTSVHAVKFSLNQGREK